MRYPGCYGFIPHTLSEDGDPCDILVANTRPITPGAVIAVRPTGVLKMTDEGGGDEKIVAVPVPRLMQRYAHVRNYTDLPEISWRQIEHFFPHYKVGKWVECTGWGDASEAKRLIREAINRSKNQGTKQAYSRRHCRCCERWFARKRAQARTRTYRGAHVQGRIAAR
jgi:inorganic pyrophosphatase